MITAKDRAYCGKNHEIVIVKGGLAYVGISSTIVDTFDDVFIIHFPKVNSQIAKNDEAVLLESRKAIIGINSPIAGRVVKVNKYSIKQLANKTKNRIWFFALTEYNMNEIRNLRKS